MKNLDLEYEKQQELLIDKLKHLLNKPVKSDLSPELRKRLLSMKKAVETKDFESVQDEIYEDYKLNRFNLVDSGGRESVNLKYLKSVMGVEDTVQTVYSKNGGKISEKYKSKEAKIKRVKEIEQEILKFKKDKLVEELTRATLVIEFLQQQVEVLHVKNKYLFLHFNNFWLNRIAAVAGQKKGKDKVFSSNNQCMQECLDEVLNAGSAEKEISKHVYLRFCRLVKKKFPNPPFLQKPRLNREEKKQDIKTQEANREALQRNEWAPTTLRTFFEKALKVKIADLS